MKISELFTRTMREAPAEEEARNAQLLARAGYVHKEMAGVYVYAPLGVMVMEKIKRVVREEMNRVGGQEVVMSVLQPRELWERTGRWDDKVVDVWFKTKLMSGVEVGLGPTHEEPVVAMMGEYLKSYKDLPVSVYQIQSKFRNELRAKSGLLRGREFAMKDMYSFARNREEHLEIYERVAEAYGRVYERVGLAGMVWRTKADGGMFTREFSDEFQAECGVGEDTIFLDRARRLAVNSEVMSDETLAGVGLVREDLEEVKAIEVGNIFHLESKYTDELGVYYTDEAGERRSIVMGCYGIGISRLMGAVAEIFADDRGLVWPEEVAPFGYYLVGIGAEGMRVAGELYAGHEAEILWDDRDGRVGEKFVDSELLGIPYRVVVSDKSLARGEVEVVARRSGEKKMLTLDEIKSRL